MFDIPRRRGAAALVLLLLPCALFLAYGCNRDGSNASSNGLTKIKVGIIGLTCEAPIFSAYELGFFKDEGLDVEFVRCEWANYKDALALGRYDVTHHLVMYFLKPIEQGLDVKMTGGIHRGCLRVQAGVKSGINSVADLRGKRIGVPGMGTPPFIFANRVLGANGIDPSKDVTWRVFPAGELGLAITKGEVDAVADSEPIGTLLLAQGIVKNIADQAKDKPYADEYCCAVIVNGKFLANNPKAAAGATRAMLKGAKWVEMNPLAAAKLSVEKKYIASTPELNGIAISNLDYAPSVSGARDAVTSAAAEMKTAGMLASGTDVDALAKRAFVELEGVTDQWIEGISVEKVAGGQMPADFDILKYAKLLTADGGPSCCIPHRERIPLSETLVTGGDAPGAGAGAKR